VNGPTLSDVAALVDDEALHELVAGMVAAAAECSIDNVAPLDLIEDLKWALSSGRLSNPAARACRLAIKQLNGATFYGH